MNSSLSSQRKTFTRSTYVCKCIKCTMLNNFIVNNKIIVQVTNNSNNNNKEITKLVKLAKR